MVLRIDLRLPGSGSLPVGRRLSLRRGGQGGVNGGIECSRGREGDRGLLLGGLLRGFISSSFFCDRDACDVPRHDRFGARFPLGRAGFALLRPREGRREHVEGLPGGGKDASGTVEGKRGGPRKMENSHKKTLFEGMGERREITKTCERKQLAGRRS